MSKISECHFKQNLGPNLCYTYSVRFVQKSSGGLGAEGFGVNGVWPGEGLAYV